MEFLKQIAQGRERKLDGPAKKVGRRRVHVCTVYLPASVSASGSQGAAMQNPGSSQSCARPISRSRFPFLLQPSPIQVSPNRLQNYKPEIACCGMKNLNRTSSQNLSLILEGIRQEIIIVLTFTAVPTQNHHASVNRYGRGVLARCNSSVLGFQGGCHSKMAQAKVLGQTSHLKIKKQLVSGTK
jgi:hypothetical protein